MQIPVKSIKGLELKTESRLGLQEPGCPGSTLACQGSLSWPSTRPAPPGPDQVAPCSTSATGELREPAAKRLNPAGPWRGFPVHSSWLVQPQFQVWNHSPAAGTRKSCERHPASAHSALPSISIHLVPKSSQRPWPHPARPPVVKRLPLVVRALLCQF